MPPWLTCAVLHSAPVTCTLDWKDPAALRELSAALLAVHFGIRTWQVTAARKGLCGKTTCAAQGLRRFPHAPGVGAAEPTHPAHSQPLRVPVLDQGPPRSVPGQPSPALDRGGHWNGCLVHLPSARASGGAPSSWRSQELVHAALASRQAFGWRWIASEAAPESLNHAMGNVKANALTVRRLWPCPLPPSTFTRRLASPPGLHSGRPLASHQAAGCGPGRC